MIPRIPELSSGRKKTKTLIRKATLKDLNINSNMEDTGSRPRTIYGGTKWTEVPRNMKSPGKRTPRETKDIQPTSLFQC